jgi:hypothetical protein
MVPLIAAAPLWAQSDQLRIRVVDPTGWVMPSAEVFLLGKTINEFVR